MSCGTYSAKFETGSFCKKTTILRFSESSTKRSITRSLLPIEVERRRVVSNILERAFKDGSPKPMNSGIFKPKLN